MCPIQNTFVLGIKQSQTIRESRLDLVKVLRLLHLAARILGR